MRYGRYCDIQQERPTVVLVSQAKPLQMRRKVTNDVMEFNDILYIIILRALKLHPSPSHKQ